MVNYKEMVRKFCINSSGAFTANKASSITGVKVENVRSYFSDFLKRGIIVKAGVVNGRTIYKLAPLELPSQGWDWVPKIAIINQILRVTSSEKQYIETVAEACSRSVETIYRYCLCLEVIGCIEHYNGMIIKIKDDVPDNLLTYRTYRKQAAKLRKPSAYKDPEYLARRAKVKAEIAEIRRRLGKLDV